MAHQNHEELSLSWDNFTTNFSTGICDLLNENHLVDITLVAEGQQIKAHRLVLSLCSPHFRQMFTQTPAIQPELVTLKNISFATLNNLIQFMYCGEVSLSQDDMPEFLSSAETLQIKGLTDNEHAPMQTVTTVPQGTKETHNSDIDYHNRESIVVQSTRKRFREESSAEQTAPKRMKTHCSMETHSYHQQRNSVDELEILVPSKETGLFNDYTQMFNNAKWSFSDDGMIPDFDTEPGDSKAATAPTDVEEAPDDQIPFKGLNKENREQQEFADQNNSIDDQVAIENPAVALIQCPHCVYKSKRNTDVTRHIRTQHTHKDDKPFKCGKCLYDTKRKYDLVRHQKTCTG